MSDWNVAAPVYVTRKTADGLTGEYEVSLWVTVLLMWLVGLNVVAWSLVGLYEAVRVVVG